jgi:hypothetical protein
LSSSQYYLGSETKILHAKSMAWQKLVT